MSMVVGPPPSVGLPCWMWAGRAQPTGRACRAEPTGGVARWPIGRRVVTVLPRPVVPRSNAGKNWAGRFPVVTGLSPSVQGVCLPCANDGGRRLLLGGEAAGQYEYRARRGRLLGGRTR